MIDRFEQINVGDKSFLTHTITAEDVELFVKLTGDDNPVHLDEAFVAGTSLRRPVVHGMLTASFISTLIGTKLPGSGALWFEQGLKFLAPVRIGDEITVGASVVHKVSSQRVLVLDVIVTGRGNREVIRGKSKVKILSQDLRDESA